MFGARNKGQGHVCEMCGVGLRVRAVAVCCGLGATWRRWVLARRGCSRARGPRLCSKKVRSNAFVGRLSDERMNLSTCWDLTEKQHLVLNFIQLFLLANFFLKDPTFYLTLIFN